MVHWKFEKRPGGWWIAYSEIGERKRFFFHLKKNAQKKDSFYATVRVSLGGFLYSRCLFNEESEEKNPLFRFSKEEDEEHLDAEIAQFPGKVRKISVSLNHCVRKGDLLLLVEAMKMEFAICAPCSGRISQIFVQEGQCVSSGDRLFHLEKDLSKAL